MFFSNERKLSKASLYTNNEDNMTPQQQREPRLLLIVPDVGDIDNSPEIIYLTSLNHIRVQVLSGYVNTRTLYDTIDNNRHPRFDFIHFAAHSTNEPIPSIKLNGDLLYSKDIRQIVKRTGCELVFINSCESGALASHLVQEGLHWAIFTNIKLADSEAWKMPLLFYGNIDRQIEITGIFSVPKAFMDAAPGDGTYGITSNYDRAGVLNVQSELCKIKSAVFWLMVAMGIQGAIIVTIIVWLITTRSIIFV